MLKLIPVVLPSLFAGSDPGIHYGMWIEMSATVVCDLDWSAIEVASAFRRSHGAKGAGAELDENQNCTTASKLLVGIGDLVWSRKGVSVVRNLDPNIPYVIVLADYNDDGAATGSWNRAVASRALRGPARSHPEMAGGKGREVNGFGSRCASVFLLITPCAISLRRES